ncbi:hypothetical protein [Flavobacterium sp.]|uniref:hypothetical protein n=1 Tax=Flavobacterium sp. TaxID=239 RepID=UPI0037510795
MNSIRKSKLIKLVTFFYFINALIEVIAEVYSNNSIIYITKPLIPLLLMVLYFYTTKKNYTLFYVLLFFSLVTNLLFISDSQESLFYGIISYTIHRVFLLILIFKLVKIKDYIPLFLAALPLGFIFFYLFITIEVPDNSYYLIFFNNLFAVLVGGIAISSYVMKDNKRNSILLISVLLFLGLQLVVYVEKYYLPQAHSTLLRPLAMSLNFLAFYAFYKFVIASEKVKQL